MIAGSNMGKLEVTLNVRAVLIQHPKKVSQRLFIHLWRPQKETERREQMDRAQGHLHGAIPIHATRNRGLVAPALELAKECGTEFVVARNGVGSAQRREMRAA